MYHEFVQEFGIAYTFKYFKISLYDNLNVLGICFINVLGIYLEFVQEFGIAYTFEYFKTLFSENLNV